MTSILHRQTEGYSVTGRDGAISSGVAGRFAHRPVV